MAASRSLPAIEGEHKRCAGCRCLWRRIAVYTRSLHTYVVRIIGRHQDLCCFRKRPMYNTSSEYHVVSVGCRRSSYDTNAIRRVTNAGRRDAPGNGFGRIPSNSYSEQSDLYGKRVPTRTADTMNLSPHRAVPTSGCPHIGHAEETRLRYRQIAARSLLSDTFWAET